MDRTEARFWVWPILASASKSLVSRWTSPVSTMIDAELTDQDGLAIGSVTSHADFPLRNVRLLYGSWAYRLGNLSNGKPRGRGRTTEPAKSENDRYA